MKVLYHKIKDFIVATGSGNLSVYPEATYGNQLLVCDESTTIKEVNSKKPFVNIFCL